ncbi:MAG: antitoxin [Gemmatimonadota bacterium]
MKTRIHVVVDMEEKARFRRCAQREGKSLSSWLRDAAREQLSRGPSTLLDSVEELRSFFDRCDAREPEAEPDWVQHRRVIERSARSGEADA